MPEGKHLRGATKKEEWEYEHIKKSAQKSGRYGKRAKEVAARTVMKHHKKKSSSKSTSSKSKSSKSKSSKSGGSKKSK